MGNNLKIVYSIQDILNELKKQGITRSRQSVHLYINLHVDPADIVRHEKLVLFPETTAKRIIQHFATNDGKRGPGIKKKGHK